MKKLIEMGRLSKADFSGKVFETIVQNLEFLWLYNGYSLAY